MRQHGRSSDIHEESGKHPWMRRRVDVAHATDRTGYWLIAG
jgi:hypothetical protein